MSGIYQTQPFSSNSERHPYHCVGAVDHSLIFQNCGGEATFDIFTMTTEIAVGNVAQTSRPCHLATLPSVLFVCSPSYGGLALAYHSVATWLG